MPMSPYVRRLRERLGPGLLELPSAGVVVFDERRRVLLVRHVEGVWTTPGGAIEPLESPADAAVREAFEETGVEVELLRVLGVYGGPDFVVRYANGDEPRLFRKLAIKIVKIECAILVVKGDAPHHGAGVSGREHPWRNIGVVV